MSQVQCAWKFSYIISEILIKHCQDAIIITISNINNQYKNYFAQTHTTSGELGFSTDISIWNVHDLITFESMDLLQVLALLLITYMTLIYLSQYYLPHSQIMASKQSLFQKVHYPQNNMR